ncbi:MAG: hypothetical protein WBO08_06590 [Mycobacterium sp.]
MVTAGAAVVGEVLRLSVADGGVGVAWPVVARVWSVCETRHHDQRDDPGQLLN